MKPLLVVVEASVGVKYSAVTKPIVVCVHTQVLLLYTCKNMLARQGVAEQEHQGLAS